MELTVSSKRLKNLAVGYKNWQILTVSRKKKVTVKDICVDSNGTISTDKGGKFLKKLCCYIGGRV